MVNLFQNWSLNFEFRLRTISIWQSEHHTSGARTPEGTVLLDNKRGACAKGLTTIPWMHQIHCLQVMVQNIHQHQCRKMHICMKDSNTGAVNINLSPDQYWYIRPIIRPIKARLSIDVGKSRIVDVCHRSLILKTVVIRYNAGIFCPWHFNYIRPKWANRSYS